MTVDTATVDRLRADFDAAIAAQRAVIDALTENVARLDAQLARCVCKQPASPAPEHEDTAGRMR